MGSDTDNNVFLCVTEYHILLSVLIATEVFNSDKYKNIIILCNSGRFKDTSIYNQNDIENIVYRHYNEKEFVSQNFIEYIFEECTNSLFLFNLNYPHFTYLAYILNKKGINTSLVQDGLGLYMHHPYTLREIISRQKWVFNFLRRLSINDCMFFFNCYGRRGGFGRLFQNYDAMANSPFITNIWLTAPDQAQYSKQKVKKIPGFSADSINRTRAFFQYNRESESIFAKNDFLFVDQRIEGTTSFIKDLSERFPLSTIYVKLHPRSRLSWAEGFKSLNNVRLIDNMTGIPLELLIQSLYRVIVISAYSAALLMNNDNCKFYYVYPWFSKRGFGKDEFKADSIFNPTKHIKVISTLNEIELF